MRTLNFDPGGERLGWAVIDQGPRYIQSGVLRFPRSKRPYQEYRVSLTSAVREAAKRLIYAYQPDRVVVEIVPPQGSAGFLMSGQSYIANVVATTIHNICLEEKVEFVQISARSWQSRIALRKSRSDKITKPQIRNGVLTHFPDLRTQMTPAQLKEWDRWDAIGIGIFSLGHVTSA